MTLQDKIHHTNEIANAIQREEKHYGLDVKNDSTWKEIDKINIELPSPQLAGTMTQQRSYAMGKAMELIEHFTRK